ncbi:MAG: hypothetical protein N3A62_05870 [Thermodesulfovibrionales bacterium]|nr:hypothetical protein [Thermodesulfovibrionales bacterium]
MKSTRYIVVVLIRFILLFSINLQTTNESRFLFDSSKTDVMSFERSDHILQKQIPNAIAFTSDIKHHPLFKKAQQATPDRYKYAVDKGAYFVPTDDGRSFYIVWTPKNFQRMQIRPMLITLHGHASWAFDEFFIWHPYAEKRGIGIIALQWWFGTGEKTQDYYSPENMYIIFNSALQQLQIKPSHVLLHGFSRGSANTYALTSIDRIKNRFIVLTISNAGGMARDFPPNNDIITGKFGSTPFRDTHWVMYCAERDPNPDRDGCRAMQTSRELVMKHGGKVELFIKDPIGDHGGFHRNPSNVNRALDVFEQLIR